MKLIALQYQSQEGLGIPETGDVPQSHAGA